MKLRSRSAHPIRTSRIRRRFYVDLEMCGGEMFLEDFDLEEFCRVLQRLVPRIQIIPVTSPSERAENKERRLVSQAVFDRAITEYCCGCSITGCCAV